MPGSILGRACRPNRSEFSAVFAETRVNTGKDSLERPPRRAVPLQAQVPQADVGPPSYNLTSFFSFPKFNQTLYSYLLT